MPALTVVVPVKVFSPVRLVVPLPRWFTAMFPVICGAKVKDGSL